MVDSMQQKGGMPASRFFPPTSDPVSPGQLPFKVNFGSNSRPFDLMQPAGAGILQEKPKADQFEPEPMFVFIPNTKPPRIPEKFGGNDEKREGVAEGIKPNPAKSYLNLQAFQQGLAARRKPAEAITHPQAFQPRLSSSPPGNQAKCPKAASAPVEVPKDPAGVLQGGNSSEDRAPRKGLGTEPVTTYLPIDVSKHSISKHGLLIVSTMGKNFIEEVVEKSKADTTEAARKEERAVREIGRAKVSQSDVSIAPPQLGIPREGKVQSKSPFPLAVPDDGTPFTSPRDSLSPRSTVPDFQSKSKTSVEPHKQETYDSRRVPPPPMLVNPVKGPGLPQKKDAQAGAWKQEEQDAKRQGGKPTVGLGNFQGRAGVLPAGMREMKPQIVTPADVMNRTQPPPGVPPQVSKLPMSGTESQCRPTPTQTEKSGKTTCQVCKKLKDLDMIYRDVPCYERCVICKDCIYHSLANFISKCPKCERLIPESENQMITAYYRSMHT